MKPSCQALIFVIGPQAVGKMTVGHELSRITGFKFMHNHQTIDLLLPIFDFGTPSFQRLLFDFRMSIFEEVAASNLPGFIFSSVLNFDSSLDWAEKECFIAPFLRRAWQVLFVELAASLETRIERNRSEHRQCHKPSKRDVDFAEKLLVAGESQRYNSHDDFPYPYPHFKIDNQTLTPEEVALKICVHFDLESSAL